MRTRSSASLAASPVLVGAVTVLVTIVAVFLSYNANTGLPFVPTYDLKANLPNGSQLVKGFEVRIGGARVGQVSKIEAKRREDGSTYAQVTMKLDKEIEPLQADTTLLVRPRSAIGLKYVELTPATGSKALESGAIIPVKQARPAVVELDDVFNMFDEKARVGSRNSLNGYGAGLAGRGGDLNRAIAALDPLLRDLEPVARNLASRETRLGRLFRALGKAASEAAPVAETQAALFVNLDTTFTALASIARPYLQESISEGPPSEELAIREFPFQGKFLANNAAFFRELRPGVATLPHSAPILAEAFEAGTRTLPKTPADQRAAGRRVRGPGRLLGGPAGPPGRPAAHAAVLLVAPDAGVPDAGPDHLQLRVAVLPQRRQRALRRRLQRHLAALHHHPEPERPPGRDRPEQRDRAGLGARRTARWRTTTSTPTRIRTRPRPGRRASARPATSATPTRSARR